MRYVLVLVGVEDGEDPRAVLRDIADTGTEGRTTMKVCEVDADPEALLELNKALTLRLQ